MSDLKKLARDWHDECFQSHPIELGSHDGIAVRLDWLGGLVQERDDLARENETLKDVWKGVSAGCKILREENAWLRGLLRECQERLDGTNKSDELWRKINAALGEK
jgi:hypothetical protein